MSRFYLDPLEGDLCIQAILQRSSHESINFIVDLEGKMLYYDTEKYSYLLESEQILQQLS